MSRGFRHALAATGLLAFSVLLTIPRASEAELLSQDSGATWDLIGQTRLEIEGIRGELLLRAALPGELRYMSVDLQDRDEQRPIALWQEGGTLRLRPIGEQDDKPRHLELAVPAQLQLELHVRESRVSATGLHGALAVEGQAVEFEGRSLQGPLELDLKKGTVDLNGAAMAVSLEGKDIEIKAKGIKGAVSLRLSGGRVNLEELSDKLDANLDGTGLTALSVGGFVQLTSNEAPVELIGSRAGGELRLIRSALDLRQSGGSFTVETNAAVKFADHAGTLYIRGYEGSVQGIGCKEGLELETEAAQVVLENLGGPTNLRGDNLDVRIDGAAAPLTIKTRGSNVIVERASAALTIENDFGDVEVRDAFQRVQVTTSDGDVRLTGLTGQLQLRAASPSVEVSWTALASQEESLVENERGDVRLSLPKSLPCRLQVQAPRGRIESSIPGVQVSEDGSQASAQLNRGLRPLISVRSGGDVYLTYLTTPEPAQAPEGSR